MSLQLNHRQVHKLAPDRCFPTQGISQLEDVALNLGEAVGGGTAPGAAVVVRLAVPFNALTSVASLAVLVATTPDARAESAQSARAPTADASNISSVPTLSLAIEPVFLGLVHLDVRHNKRKGVAGFGLKGVRLKARKQPYNLSTAAL